jgi:hypothetical protein
MWGCFSRAVTMREVCFCMEFKRSSVVLTF